MAKKVGKIIIIFIILIILILGAILFNVKDKILKQIYPTTYAEYVNTYAEEYEVDPLLIFSIIKAESNFKPEVKSKSGAVGLMQLMEATAKETAEKVGMEYDSLTLYEPEKNIQLGVKYFSDLYKNYDGNINLALAAYNAGSANLKSWIAKGNIKEDGSDIENIPVKETNNYVRKILRDYEIYQELYVEQIK